MPRDSKNYFVFVVIEIPVLEHTIKSLSSAQHSAQLQQALSLNPAVLFSSDRLIQGKADLKMNVII